jgi:hypothetical protein
MWGLAGRQNSWRGHEVLAFAFTSRVEPGNATRGSSCRLRDRVAPNRRGFGDRSGRDASACLSRRHPAVAKDSQMICGSEGIARSRTPSFKTRLHERARAEIGAALTKLAAALSRPPLTVTGLLELLAATVPDFGCQVRDVG